MITIIIIPILHDYYDHASAYRLQPEGDRRGKLGKNNSPPGIFRIQSNVM